MTEDRARKVAECFKDMAEAEERYAKKIGVDTWMGANALEKAENFRAAHKALNAYPAYKKLQERLYPMDTEQDKNYFAVCPVCGHRIREGDKHCVECGQRVRYVSELEWADRKAREAMEQTEERHIVPEKKKIGRKKGRLLCIETFQEYDTVKEAAAAHGLHVQTLQKHLGGYYETAGGYHWEWRDM